MYTVNGQSLRHTNTSVFVYGNDDFLEVTGFNFADSGFLSCRFGNVTKTEDLVLDQYTQTSYKCSVPSVSQILIGEGSETRADGKEYTKYYYPTYRFGEFTYSDDPVSKVPHGGGHKIVCKALGDPVYEDFFVYSFSVANTIYDGNDEAGATLTKMDMHRSSNALLCDKTHDFGTLFEEDMTTYAISLWVYTFDTSGDQVVVAFEENVNEGAKIYGSLMFDGKSFFYYDDNILSTGPGSVEVEPDMWHFVVLTVDAEGEGRLQVDCELSSAFTTSSRPPRNRAVKICGSTRSFSTFTGLLDEIAIWKDFTSTETECPSAFTVNKGIHPSNPGSALLYYRMDTRTLFGFENTLMLDQSVSGMSGGGLTTHIDMEFTNLTFVKASAPWRDPFLVERDSLSILPGGLSNVTLSGVNLAPSPFFRVKSRDGNLPLLSVSDQSQSISSASIQVEGECYTNASLEVTNNYLAGDGVALTIPVSSVNLLDGLVHHYPSDNTEENRNLIKDSASQLPFILSIPQNVDTICTWVLFDNLPDFPSAGWKFLCYVEGTESTNATVYLNGYQAADEAHREVIARLF